MKKKFITSFLAGTCALCCALGFAACVNTTGKTDKFIKVSDGVFASAGYTSSSSDKKKASKVALANVIAFDSRSADSGINAAINELYTAVETDSNTGLLDDYNLNYIKGDTLYQGANLASMFKSMASVLGDGVFSNVYDITKIGMPDSVAKLVEGDYYTLYGVSREGSTVTSAIQIDFKEYATAKFVFKLAQYSKMNGISELHFSYYDSESVAFVATLQGDSNVDFNTYEENYESFAVSECTIAVFGRENYVSDTSGSTQHDETILKFVKDNLGYDNQTYKNLANISGGKSIGNKEANQIGSLIYQNRYINPFTGTNDKVSVSNEYIIPSDVTVVASASIPATRKLIVPAHVEKILDSPFKYPQYVEDIVFEDPDNGALVQIGNDDIINDLGTWVSRLNNSYNFLISYTQVKNFTLPKTVKKIEGPIYITTEMEVLDLSKYHPDYELPDSKSDYTVSLYTPYYNRTYGLFKELGSVQKFYANKDFTLQFYGSDRFNPEHGIKDGGEEYSTYNKVEDKHYTYSPSVELYQVMEAVYGDHSDETARKFAQYRGYTKTEYFVQELITTGLHEAFDIDDDLFGKLSLTIDADDFADVYDLLKSSETGKEFSLKLLENGQPKTALKLFYNNEQGTVSDGNTMITAADGQIKMISDLKFAEVFLAPSAMESYILVEGVKQYFAGWSFKKDASRVDVFAGEKIANFFQNMYAVYMPETAGIEYIENENSGYTAKLDNINADVIVIADTYNSKTVNELMLGRYTCKKIIMPMSIGTANQAILEAIAKNQIDSFRSVTNISDMEDGWYIDSLLRDKLKECNGVFEENGLYYIKNFSSNYFLLFAADEDLTGTVFIPNDCEIMVVKFGSGVTGIAMPNDTVSRLKYISNLKFDTISSFSIPSSVVLVDNISGTVTGLVTFRSTKQNLKIYHIYDFYANNIFVPAAAFDAEYLTKEMGRVFSNTGIKLLLDCQYEDIERLGFEWISEEMYFYSPNEPDYDDPDVSNFHYWHYDSNFNFVIWE